ncbi:MAG TPA: ABC transporter permease [Jatrophihabitans sp.]|jgi:hypothetical protein
MTWFMWRQHRVQVMIAAALVVAFAVPVWITGRHLADLLQACRTGTTCGGIFQGYQGFNTVVDLTVIVPLLIGVFWGATIIGRELESGTATLAWTQSVTRRRWLISKLGVLFGFTLLCAGAVTGLVTWWSNTHNAIVETRFAGLQFDIQAIAPIGYALFASALGLAAGVLWGRALPAMATTIGGFVAVRLIVELWARPHYLEPITRILSFAKSDGIPNGASAISTEVTRYGHVVSGPMPAPAQCISATSRPEMNECMHRLGYAIRATYQPAGRFWTFQWIEFGIFAGLAAVLTAVGVIAVLRREG